MHRAYNQVVRDVARETGSFLVDMEDIFNSMESLDAYFLEDGIHLTVEGNKLLAGLIVETLEKDILQPVNNKPE